MGQSGLRSQADIAESVLFVVEFRVLIVEVIASSSGFSQVLLVLSDLTEFILNTVGHGIEGLDNVLGLLLEDRVLSKVSEFKVNALGPVADLVVHNVNALEPVS